MNQRLQQRYNYVTYVSRAARRMQSARSASIVVIFAVGCVSLAACNLITVDDAERHPTDVFTRIRSIDLLPRSVNPQEPNANAPDRRQAAIYTDENVITLASDDTRGQTKSVRGGSDGYELNFENTPVATVAKAILGDILGVGYTIDPRVQGTVSLSSGRAVPKKDLLFVLESALRMSGIALVHDAQGYRLIPTAEAVAAGSADWARDPSAGFGISVIPLEFVSAQTLIKLLDNYAAKPGMVRAEPSRNLIIIQGNSADRRAAIQTALSFDADWMQGQSVGIYPVSNSTLEPIIAELSRIIDSGQGGLNQDLVKLEPISRQNAILVLTRKPELLKRVESWITRLDKSGGAGTDVKVYRMRYGDARQVASLLNDMFVGANSGNAFDSPKNQLSPGSGMVASSSSAPSLNTSSQSPAQSSAASGMPQTTQPSNFDARFGSQRVAGPSSWASGSNSSSSPPPGATTALLPNVRITPDAVNN